MNVPTDAPVTVSTEVIWTDWMVGAHAECLQGKIDDTLKSILRMGMYTTQVFLGSRLGFKRTDIPAQSVVRANQLLARFPTSVFSHFPYTSNLAGSTTKLAWSGSDEQDFKTLACIQGVQSEIRTLNKLDAKTSGVVIHPGSFPQAEQGLLTIAQTINKIAFPNNNRVPLLLENAAGAGTALCKTVEEIKTVLDHLDPSIRTNVGVCIDTCHLHSYGEYDVSKIEDILRFLDTFDRAIGLEHLKLIHLNDSRTPLRSRVDLHARLGLGSIWGESHESLVYLLDYCKHHSIPMVLETTSIDMLTLMHLDQVLAKTNRLGDAPLQIEGGQEVEE